MDIQDFGAKAGAYVGYCRDGRALSRNTLLAYEQDLDCFARHWRKSAADIPFCESLVLSYLTHIRHERAQQPATVRRRVHTLRSLSAWLEKTGEIERSPFAELELDLRIPKRLPRPVDRAIVAELLDRKAHAPTPGSDATTRLAIKLMVATGVRVGELTNIRTGDLLEGGRRIRIHGKGDRERIVYVANAELLGELRTYAAASAADGRSRGFLLRNRSGNRLTEHALRQRLKRLAADLGIEQRLTPHRFRHSAATFLIEEGVDIRLVQRLLGHASIATTEIYTRVSDTSLINAMQMADPLSKLGSEFT